MQKIPKTTAFPFILTLILRISYTRFIFFPFAWNLILQSRIYLCKVDFTFSIHPEFGDSGGKQQAATPSELLLAAPPRPANRHISKLPLSGLGSGSAKYCRYSFNGTPADFPPARSIQTNSYLLQCKNSNKLF